MVVGRCLKVGGGWCGECPCSSPMPVPPSYAPIGHAVHLVIWYWWESVAGRKEAKSVQEFGGWRGSSITQSHCDTMTPSLISHTDYMPFIMARYWSWPIKVSTSTNSAIPQWQSPFWWGGGERSDFNPVLDVYSTSYYILHTRYQTSDIRHQILDARCPLSQYIRSYLFWPSHLLLADEPKAPPAF